MSKAADRAYIVRQIMEAAQLYRRNLVGRRFLYVFDNRYIEVLFRAQNFCHLTGVDTLLSARDFYRLAIRGRLQAPQIFFSQRHPYDLCARKTQHICNIARHVSTDCLMLEEITTQTRSYAFGTTDLSFTLCLNRERDPSGVAVGDCYIAESLRDGDSMSRSGNVYVVTHILSRSNDCSQYTDLCYMDSHCTLEDLPAEVHGMMAGGH